jgi:peptidoglycan/LPS O-acetylase OafA/YrhL
MSAQHHRGTPIQYRPEIDGLRALAVCSVILYHAGFGGGGFVGVDVFFVISGFLITSIIDREIAQGNFSIAHFYERRARRILPALTCVVMAALLAGWFLLLPDAFDDLGRSAVATALFVSNIFFWHEVGYFSPNAELLPLLHTWSLAIEEQFYVFFPLLLLLVGRWQKPVLWVIGLGSLALSFVALHLVPSIAFYMLPPRAWELMAGALLAIGALPTVAGRLPRNLLAAAGLSLILAAVFLYTSDTPFPGAAALLPCLGTAAIIHAGEDTQVARLLGLPLVRFVGLISYSAYLWHWLIISFTKHWLVTMELPPLIAAICVLATFVAAVLSWRYIELPFRRGSGRRVVQFSVAATATILAAAIAPIVMHGFPQRLSQQQRLYAASDMSSEGKACLNRPVAQASRNCLVGLRGSPTFLLWGDSHAAALLPAVDEAAKRTGRSGIFYGYNLCPAFAGAAPAKLAPRGRSECEARNKEILAHISEGVDTIVLAGFWPEYSDMGIDVPARLKPMVQALEAKGKRVVILSGLPNPGFNVRWRLARGAAMPPIRPTSPLPPVGRATIVSLSPALCDDRSCAADVDGRPLFADTNHISEHAARRLIGPYLAKTLWSSTRFGDDSAEDLHRVGLLRHFVDPQHRLL